MRHTYARIARSERNAAAELQCSRKECCYVVKMLRRYRAPSMFAIYRHGGNISGEENRRRRARWREMSREERLYCCAITTDEMKTRETPAIVIVGVADERRGVVDG